MTITREQWEAKGRELFGDDQSKWRFVCPRCNREASIESTRAELTKDELEHARAGGYRVEQECIGRYIEGLGCNWCAYGLFRGPVIVQDGDKELCGFDFAGKPFTGGRT